MNKDITSEYDRTKNSAYNDNNSTSDTITLDMEVTPSEEMKEGFATADELTDVIVDLPTKDPAENIKNDTDLVKVIQNPNSLYNNVVWVQFFNTGENAAGPEALDYSAGNRNHFILLVFSIVLIMLLATATFNVVVLNIPECQDFIKENSLILMIPACMIMMAINYALACSPCARKPPMNFICLVLAVICMSVITVVFTSKYRTEIIIYAMLATLLVLVVCMGLACTSFDFTKYMLYAIVIGAAVGAVSLVAFLGMMLSGHYLKPLHLGLLIVGTIMQCVFLIMELQAILGGRTVEIAENEYAFAAYLLYTSIIDLFIKMIQNIGTR